MNVERKFRGIRESFGLVQGNARVLVLVQPFFYITFYLYYPYLSLYMLGIGCTSEQIGLINAVSMAVGTVLAVFSGWVTDRLGRRRTSLIMDMLAWPVACLLWGISNNYLWLLAGSVFNAAMRIGSVSWSCIVAEGTLPGHRLNVFWWINIMSTIAVFATPLTNLLIDPLGLVPAIRLILIGTSVVMGVVFAIRGGYLKEMPIGIERIKASSHEPFSSALKLYVPLFKLMRNNPALTIFIAIRALYYMQLGLKNTYLPITVVNGLGFSSNAIGTMSLITGAVMLLSQFLLLPALKRLNIGRLLSAGMAVLIVSTAILLFSPPQNEVFFWVSTVTGAAGSLVAVLTVDTTAANAMPDEYRAPLTGLLTILTAALSAPFMWLGGWLAGLPGLGPRLPLVLMIMVFVVCMILGGIARRAAKINLVA